MTPLLIFCHSGSGRMVLAISLNSLSLESSLALGRPEKHDHDGVPIVGGTAAAGRGSARTTMAALIHSSTG